MSPPPEKRRGPRPWQETRPLGITISDLSLIQHSEKVKQQWLRHGEDLLALYLKTRRDKVLRALLIHCAGVRVVLPRLSLPWLLGMNHQAVGCGDEERNREGAYE